MQLIAYTQSNTFYDVRILGESELPGIECEYSMTLSKTGGDWCQNIIYTFHIPKISPVHTLLHNTQYQFTANVTTSNSLVHIYGPITELQDLIHGNPYYVVEIKVDPAYINNSFDIIINYELKTKNNLQLFSPSDPYPLTNVPPAISSVYLAYTPLVNYNNTLIQGVANNIVQGKTTTKEVVEACAEWIHANINDVTNNPSNIASDVLLSGGGDCDGQAHLMSAFLRYLGIPSKITNCYSIDMAKDYPIWNQTVTFPGGTGTGLATGHAFYQVYYPSSYSWITGDPAQKTLHFYHNTNIITCTGLDSDITDDIEEASTSGTYNPATETPPQGLYLTTNDPYVVANINCVTSNFDYEYHTLFYGLAPDQNRSLLFNSSDKNVVVGENDYVEIKDPPPGIIPPIPENTKVFSPGDEVSFYAEFDSYTGNTWVTSWDWKIELYHTEGSYIYYEYTGLADLGDYSFRQFTSSSNLPCFDWARDLNNNIHGKVIATAHVNDGWNIQGEWIIGLYDDAITFIQNYTQRNGSETISGKNIIVGSNVDPEKTFGPVNLYGGSLTIDACDQIEIVNDFNAAYGATLEIK